MYFAAVRVDRIGLAREGLAAEVVRASRVIGGLA